MVLLPIAAMTEDLFVLVDYHIRRYHAVSLATIALAPSFFGVEIGVMVSPSKLIETFDSFETVWARESLSLRCVEMYRQILRVIKDNVMSV